MHTKTKKRKRTPKQTYYEHPKRRDEEAAKAIHRIRDWRLHRHKYEVVLLYNNTHNNTSTQNVKVHQNPRTKPLKNQNPEPKKYRVKRDS